MQAEEVKQLLESRLQDCEIQVQGDGYSYQITVISPAFAGMMPVKKQQFVYAALNDEIASGAIHAVTIKTYTPDEWEKVKHLQVSSN